MKQNITQEELKKLVTYNPDTGDMIWLPRPREIFKTEGAFKSWNTRFSYKKAGCFTDQGYIRINLNGVPYLVHRLAWLYVNGRFPFEATDHINGIRSDNRISNLREVTLQENARNSSKPSTNTSGFVGVRFNEKLGKWTAAIKMEGKSINLGGYLNKQDAIKERMKADIKYKFHKNHGKDLIIQ